MTAASLPVRLFREILLWPLAFEVGNDGKGMAGLAGQLAGTPWKAVTDPRRHLREDGEDGPLPREAYAEVVYFHPFVQRFLFANPTDTDDRHSRPMRLFRRTDVTGVKLTWGGDWALSPRTYTLAVDRVNLYLFDSGIAILVVEVSAADGRGMTVVEPGLPPDPSAPGGTHPLTVADVQNILRRFRRAYPPYWTGNARNIPGECFQSVKWLCGSTPVSNPGTDDADTLVEHLKEHGQPPVLSHWRALLAPQDHATALRHVVDDRIPTMALVVVDDPFAIDPGNQMRLCFADGPGNAPLPYAKDFLGDFESGHTYDRFWETGHDEHTTRYLCCGYNFVVLAKDGEFLRTHLQTHFRRHYFQIGLLSHHQKAALLTLSDGVSGAVDRHAADLTVRSDGLRPGSDLHRAMERLHGRALAFTHRFWFTDVTNQIQGQELSALWRRQLGTEAAFEQLNREITESNAYLSVRNQDRSTTAALRLNYLATVGLVLALTTGALGMNVLAGGKWDQVDSWFELGAVFAAMTIIILLGAWAFTQKRLMDIVFRPCVRWAWIVLLSVGFVYAILHLKPPEKTVGDRVKAVVDSLIQ